MFRGMSLAMKCLLLFGGAIVLIILAALVGPWLRMNTLIDEGQLELSRQLVDAWESAGPAPGSPSLRDDGTGPWLVPRHTLGQVQTRAGVEAREVPAHSALRDDDEFVREAIGKFTQDAGVLEHQSAVWRGSSREYHYARAVRTTDATGSPRTLGLVELKRRVFNPVRLLVFNTLYLLVAGFFVLALALVVFWLLTHKIILAPVRGLRETAERVRQGNLAIRSDIQTGDEFQELSETFNSMLGDMQSSQDRLRSINTALDMKLHELSESNMALHQAAKVKGEFLASVSHELRTPLNSIIGFAELLQEIARADADSASPPPDAPRRLRYLDNILTAGRGLLNLINSLLEMARIEAGKIDLKIERTNMKDLCEGLLGLIAPQAQKKQVVLKLEASNDLPLLRTDPRKVQQIIFNFLSNAVKFTLTQDKGGRVPEIILRAERLPASASDQEERVRVSVIDNGVGIPKEEVERIFEKFYQLEGGHTREQSGTGLGLAICKELAHILHCEIQVVSDVGRGSMFSLILPMELQEDQAQEAAMEARMRASMASGREFAETNK